MEILSKAYWGAQPTKRPPSIVIMQGGLTFHWNGGPLGQYREEWVPDYLRSVQNYHMWSNALGENGANDIAYNFGIDRFGRVWEGRGWDVWNAASGGSPQNANSVAVEFIFGKGDPFPQAAKDAAIWLSRQYLAKGPNRQPIFRTHRDWIGTECPGNEIIDWVHNTLPGLVAAPPPDVNPVIGEEPMRLFKDPNGTYYILRDDKKIPIETVFNHYQIPSDKWFPSMHELHKAGVILDNPDTPPQFSWEAMVLIQNGAVE